jgi:hypothetical protein
MLHCYLPRKDILGAGPHLLPGFVAAFVISSDPDHPPVITASAAAENEQLERYIYIDR